MCEQCSAKTCFYEIGLRGWSLVRATQDGLEMKTGDWGLVECNDPTYIWSVTPEINRVDFNSDGEEIDITEETWKFGSVYTEKVREFEDGLYGSPRAGYELVKACIEAGYDAERDGCFAHWFFNYLAHKIAIQIPHYHDDPFCLDWTPLSEGEADRLGKQKITWYDQEEWRDNA